jgi:hypothetical protein
MVQENWKLSEFKFHSVLHDTGFTVNALITPKVRGVETSDEGFAKSGVLRTLKANGERGGHSRSTKLSYSNGVGGRMQLL